jgi:hypothetical protein
MEKRVKSPQRLDAIFLATAADGCYREAGDVAGTALEIVVRQQGQSKRARARYPGHQFGENRVQRLPLGNYDKEGLSKLRRTMVVIEDLIREGKSPKKHFTTALERQRAKGMTLRDAMNEFYDHGRENLWNDSTRIQNERRLRRDLSKLEVMDMVLDDIRAVHLQKALGKDWRLKQGVATRNRSLIHSALQYQIDKDDGHYCGPNPASWRKNSSLSRQLGEPPPYEHHIGPKVDEMPDLMHYLRTRHNKPKGYLSGPEAAYAYDKTPKQIKWMQDSGVFSGMIRDLGTPHEKALLIPISELKRVFGPFKREPILLPRLDVWLYDRAVQFLGFTPVRANNVFAERLNSKDVPELHGLLKGGLRWRQIYRDERLIKYLPRRKNPNGPG